MVGWSWLYLLRVLVLGVLRMFEEQVSWGDGSDGLRRMVKFRGAVIFGENFKIHRIVQAFKNTGTMD